MLGGIRVRRARIRWCSPPTAAASPTRHKFDAVTRSFLVLRNSFENAGGSNEAKLASVHEPTDNISNSGAHRGRQDPPHFGVGVGKVDTIGDGEAMRDAPNRGELETVTKGVSEVQVLPEVRVELVCLNEVPLKES